ncbi:efflux RND transporter periplasmic adaptor subunit [Aminiphilus sp.]|uniref:efflux RND transporter periplasmic adaptor subunit n=1 Tax=Aminiphilus sp. TaxID=1872488 RepID=UPI001BCC605A|nr:efflux RND transporter periplasmic adaptor subunit [Aminiphilus sp.]
MTMRNGWKKRKRLGFVVLLLLLVSTCGLSKNVERADSESSGDALSGRPALPEGDDRDAVIVVLEKAESARFEDVIKVQGNLKAKNFALVSSRTDNLIEEIFVREGDRVVGGETKLFRLDGLRLEKEVQIAQRDLQSARLGMQEQAANLQKTEVELRKAEVDYRRYKNLYEEGTVSKSALEERQSLYEQLLFLQRRARSLVDLAKETERKALSALAIAEKELRDAVTVAPLDGIVSQRMAEPGEMAGKGKPILRIDDVTALEASAFLPGQFYARVIPGETIVRIGTPDWGPEDLVVTYKSPVVDTTLRTFEIKCDMKGDGLRIVPGVLVDMRIVLASHEGLGVPLTAVLERGGAKVVFVARDGFARMVRVETGLETAGRVEITGGDLTSSDMVVVKGQFLLNDGAPLRTQSEAR